MKRLLLTLILSLVIAHTAYGEDICKRYANMAENFMRIRQQGTPESKAMAEARATVNPAIVALMGAAYQISIASTEKAKLMTIIKFGNAAYIDCIEFMK